MWRKQQWTLACLRSIQFQEILFQETKLPNVVASTNKKNHSWDTVWMIESMKGIIIIYLKFARWLYFDGVQSESLASSL